MNRFDVGLSAVLLSAAVTVGLVGVGSYTLFLLTIAFVYGALASSLDLVVGLTGRISVAHAAFYGLGAYATGILLVRTSLPWWIDVALGVGSVVVVAAVTGGITLRLTGLYFALGTMSVGVIFTQLVELPHLSSLTGGSTGLGNIPRPASLTSDSDFYWIFLGIVVVISATKLAIMTTDIGRRLLAIRDDEELAGTLGVWTIAYKVSSFVLAGAFAGLVGAFYAMFFRYVDPESFSINVSFNILVWLLVGGVRTLAGPVIGAALLWTLPQQVANVNPAYTYIGYGALLVLVVIASPGGILGAVNDAGRWVLKRVLHRHSPRAAPDHLTTVERNPQ